MANVESLLQHIDLKKWSLPFVDPVSHQCKNISMLPDDMGTDITPYVLIDSPKIEQMRVPLQNIKVVVHAGWVQKGQGAMNLFPYIKKSFPTRRVLSMTGDALKASFPSIGQTLGKKMGRKTGYTVLSSKMILCSAKTFDTVPVTIKDRECFLPVKEYKGHFWVQWACAYRRQEKAELFLCWRNGDYIPLQQPSNTEVCKTFDFKVNKEVISDGSDAFFDTKEGRLAISQAVEQSIYAGLQSRQAYLLKVDIPFVSSLKFKIGDTVTFAKEKTEFIKGRITRLKSFCDAEQAKTTVWINFSKEAINLENLKNSLRDIVAGVTQKKQEEKYSGFSNITNIEPEHLIKSVSVRNAACQQGELVKNKEFESKTDLVSVLKNNMTAIYLDLHDITNKQIIYCDYEFIKK